VPHRQEQIIGREEELQQLLELLDAGGIITLTGTGGVGKTHLALEASRRWLQQTERATSSFCDLSECAQDGLVEATIASALGLASLGLLRAQSLGPTLLVLDNCEHLLAQVADAVRRIASASSSVKILATSREALGVSGERIVPVKPLEVRTGRSLDAAQASPGVRLLVTRAQERGVDLSLDEHSAETLLALCRRLDGLPLAIELAAARMRSMTAEEILNRLDQRLQILVRRKPRGPARHQGLHAVIDSSYQMISTTEQQVLERVSVFRGEFGTEAVEFLCEDLSLDSERLLDVLDSLVDRSLLVARPRAGLMRYVLYETLREFAASKLAERGERTRVEDRFVSCTVQRCQTVLDRLSVEWPANMITSLNKDFANLQAAFQICAQSDQTPDRAFLLVAASNICVHEGHASEIAALAEQAIRRWPRDDHEYASLVYAAMASGHMVSGALSKVSDAAWAGLRAKGPPLGAISCRRALAISQLYEGQIDAASCWIEDALDEAGPDSPLACDILIQKARILGFGQMPQAGIPIVAQARKLAGELNSPDMMAASEQMAGWLQLMGSPTLAKEHFDRALQMARRLNFLGVCASALLGLGSVAAFEGDKAVAAERFTQALDTWEEIGDQPQIWATIRWNAFWLAQWGFKLDAARLFGALEASAAAPMLTPLEKAFFAQVEAGLRDGLGELDMARAEGAGWSLHDATQLMRARLRKLRQGSTELDLPRAPSARAPAANGTSRSGVFRREGGLWKLSYDGKTAELRDLKGLKDLALLLSQPDREVHCLELAGRRAGSSGPLLDARARREYEQRIQSLQEELAEAEDHNDFGRAEKAGEELDALTEQLSAAFGLGGRARDSGNDIERSRSTVTWRVRSAIKKIQEAHEALAKHLQASIQTGTYLVYSPPAPVSWQL
jgi:predicted ATPase